MTFQAAFYKAIPPGTRGIYNRLVQHWEKGPHSHCELIFSDGKAASASFMDGGVRFKDIVFDPAKWDFITLPDHMEARARQWFKLHEGDDYDVMGNVHLVIGFFAQSKGKEFCSEAVAEALGLGEGWRFGPNALFRVLTLLVELERRHQMV